MSGPILNALSSEREPVLGPPASGERRWSHWQLNRDDNGVAWLLMDKADAKVNVLAAEVLEQLDAILDELNQNKPKGLVLRSAKDAGFCVGADINEFKDLGSPDQAAEKLRAAHAVADKLAAASYPTVAVIHGNCLGGGLELVLCCDYRLAVPGSKLGFPEVMIGLHPGLGGTFRSTELVEPFTAMQLMLTGKNLDERRAKKAGLIDAIVEERHVKNAVEAAVTRKLKAYRRGMKGSLENLAPVRRFAANRMRKQAAAKAPPKHYPAPGALIDLWEQHGGNPKAMQKAEIESFSKLLTSDTAQGLMHVFFLRENMKRQTRASDTPIRHVHVIGAGTMGADIAAWCALQGMRASLFDMEPKALARAIGKASKLAKKKHLSNAQQRDLLDRLIPDFKQQAVGQADLVIEAVPEKLELKQKVYSQIEPQLKDGAVLATNTSSIPLEQLADSLQRPERFVGLHFFNPVAQMQLVEVVRHDKLDDDTLDTALGFVGQISRLPAPVGSAPGFLVNRALMPYLLEAMVMLDEGVAAETIDKAAEDFGMPMGPIELADQVGLDICVDVAEMLREQLDTEMPAVPDWLRKKVDDGDLGRKTGHGCYHWKDGKAEKKDDAPKPDSGMADRLLLPMLNTCMTCLREGIIPDEQLLDGAMIFGTGFAPFRGGPMHYAHQRGFEDIASCLQTLADKHGPRFTPDPGWRDQDSQGS